MTREGNFYVTDPGMEMKGEANNFVTPSSKSNNNNINYLTHKMDEDFLMDFDVATPPPVFAKKSAPPPPPAPDNEDVEASGNAGVGKRQSAEFSTPSSSILDTTNDENSSAAANSFNPSPSPSAAQSGSKQQKSGSTSSRADSAAAMELDNGAELPAPPHFEEKEGKKARSRTRNKRAEKKGPDVPTLLASLEKGDLPPPPLLASDPLPSPQSASNVDNNRNDEDLNKTKDNKTCRKTKGGARKDDNDKGEKEKFGKEGPVPGSSSQRTSGRIPKIKHHDTSVPSHNRQWKAGESDDNPVRKQPESKNQQQQRGDPKGDLPAAGPSGYGKKPGSQESTCVDITSFRFLPDDDHRLAILIRKMRGDPPLAATDPANKTIIHQFPTVFSDKITGVPLHDAPGASVLCSTNDRFMTIADFATVEIGDPPVFHTIPRRDSIVFVLVNREEGKRGKLSWEIPTLPQCQDFTNAFISAIYGGDDISWAGAYVRSGRWGKAGTILLSSSVDDTMSEFRRQLALWTYRGYSYDMYPKDVLTAKPDVSILLRGSMKTFDTEMVPKVLFARNREHVAGSLRVLATKHFSAEETSHKGESKEHWRSIELKGCDQFMRCLRFIPESHPFHLGFDSVQIKGGLRPLEENQAVVAGSKRSWASIPPPQVPLLQDPRNIFPSTHQPDENAPRGAKRGRNQRGRRGSRGRFGRS